MAQAKARPLVLPDYLDCKEFVNADDIARGLSAFHPEGVAREAGRLMLSRLSELAQARTDFAFETTLASRSFSPWLRRRQAEGYAVNLLYCWLPSADMAVARVESRVRAGGHRVPEEDIRRRYERSRRNFLQLYVPIVTKWEVYDTSKNQPSLIAYGKKGLFPVIVKTELWEYFSN